MMVRNGSGLLRTTFAASVTMRTARAARYLKELNATSALLAILCLKKVSVPNVSPHMMLVLNVKTTGSAKSVGMVSL